MAPNWLKNCAKKYTEAVYKRFGTNSGKMLLATSAVGVALSTLAQAGAILFNEKYSVSQKAFMIPQELTEGVVSIVSLFIITTPIQMLAKKYSTTGKILTADLKRYMQKNNLMNKRGDWDFNLKTHIEESIKNLEKSDVFINASENEKKNMTKNINDVLQKYNIAEDTTSAIATALGAIFSTSLILPYARNYSASYYQKVNLRAYDTYNNVKQRNKDLQVRTYPQTQIAKKDGLKV